MIIKRDDLYDNNKKAAQQNDHPLLTRIVHVLIAGLFACLSILVMVDSYESNYANPDCVAIVQEITSTYKEKGSGTNASIRTIYVTNVQYQYKGKEYTQSVELREAYTPGSTVSLKIEPSNRQVYRKLTFMEGFLPFMCGVCAIIALLVTVFRLCAYIRNAIKRD